MKTKLALFAFGIMFMMAFPIRAEVITSADGVLSIDRPSTSWTFETDSDAWLTLTDGKNSVRIWHLRAGEELPVVTVPKDESELICQTFIATHNEVFVAKAAAVSSEALEEVISMLGTIQILKYDTKTALKTSASVSADTPVLAQAGTQGSSDTAFGIRTIDHPYTVTADRLNIRSGYSYDATIVGTLEKGDQIRVTGAVTKDGADYGWYQVSYSGQTAYAVASYLEANASDSSSPETDKPDPSSSEEPGSKSPDPANDGKYPVASSIQVLDADGRWITNLTLYSDGVYYSDGEMAPYYDDGDGNFYGGIGEGRTLYRGVTCEYCGELVFAGEDYQSHLMYAHGSEIDDEDDNDVESEPESIRCDICHLYFHAGEEYDAHRASHEDGSWEEANAIQCPYCGEWVQAGVEYRGHVLNNHPEYY